MSPQFLGALVVAVALFLTAKRKIEAPDEPLEEDEPSLPERVKRWGAGTSYSVGTRLKAGANQ